jgi:signal transduction histidine kinase
VLADASQLRQVVMNLVTNAAEAIGTRPGIVDLATGVASLDRDDLPTLTHEYGIAPGEHVCLEVRDNGSGMDSATLEKIFDPFFSTKFTGRGLGLAAVLGIVRGHKGAIRVASTPDRGSTFTIYLPRAAVHTA